METILIIEDDELTAVLMITALRRFGLKLMHAATAQEGLHLAKMYPPKLILLDMRLPGMNGWELAPLLKKDAKLGQIPLLQFQLKLVSRIGLMLSLLAAMNFCLNLLNSGSYANESRLIVLRMSVKRTDFT